MKKLLTIVDKLFLSIVFVFSIVKIKMSLSDMPESEILWNLYKLFSETRMLQKKRFE